MEIVITKKEEEMGVIKVADTGSFMMPVPRHWHPVNLQSIEVINVSNESWIPVSATWITFRYVIPALDAGIQKFFEHESLC